MGRISGIAIKTDVNKYDSADIIKNLFSPNYQEYTATEFEQINPYYSDKKYLVVCKTEKAIWVYNEIGVWDSFFDKENKTLFEKFSHFFGNDSLIIGFYHSDESCNGYSKIINNELIRCRFLNYDILSDFGELSGIEVKWFKKPVTLEDYKGNIEEDYDDEDYEYNQAVTSVFQDLNNRLTICAMHELLLEEVDLTELHCMGQAFEIRYFILNNEPVELVKVEKALWTPKRSTHEDILQRLVEYASNGKYDVQRTDDEHYIRHSLYQLWHNNEVLATHSLRIEKDVKKAKQHFYKCARLHEYSLKRFGEHNGSDTYTVLCDNAKVIKNSTRILGKHGQKVMNTEGSWEYAEKCIIKGDYDAYRKAINVLKNNRFNVGIWEEKYIAFYDALVAENQIEMESILAYFIIPKIHWYLSENNCFNRFYSISAVKLAKLAWYKGFKVQVDSPLVPYELLPISPLQDEEYEDYDFVKQFLG